MKLTVTTIAIIGFSVVSCKKESTTNMTQNDSITIPKAVEKVPVPHPVDTLVAAPKTDSSSASRDSAVDSK